VIAKRKTKAPKVPPSIDIRAGVNCILSNVSETMLPPLILRNPQVAIINTNVAMIILVVLSNFPIVLNFGTKLLFLRIIWDWE
jgi:hypothetical protein